MYDLLLKRILRREKSLFAQDLEDNYQELINKIAKSRILIIGAAGSIGSAFVKLVIPFQPSVLHLVDISENNLVEVVRDLRSTNLAIPDDFKTYSISLGNTEFEVFLKNQIEYDYVLNFSALKHVRAERDPYTLMRMIYTNVLSVKKLLDFFSNYSIKKFFSVSSDKATNPVSIMGATKTFMEKVMILYSDEIPCSTSRFANVAFSDGSLLFGFNKRIEKKQPISAPSDVKRYLISHEEAGTLCLLSCFLGNNRDNYFPKLNRDMDMYTFSQIAEIFLDNNNLKPMLFNSEKDAKEATERIKSSSGEWPCYFSVSDTNGEKMYEEFYTEDDDVDFDRYKKIGVIRNKSLEEKESIVLNEALIAIERMRKEGCWARTEIIDCIKMAVPEMQHHDKEKNLDEKM